MLYDRTGLAVSGATVEALALFETALRQLHCAIGDPLETVEAAITATPVFTMAHLLRAQLCLSRIEPAGVMSARQSIATARCLARTERETLHMLAADAWAGGRLRAASGCFDDILLEHPRDSLALQMGHLLDFHRGDLRSLRDRVARVLPAWSAALPQHQAALRLLAFGLEESAGPRARGTLENFMATHNWWHLVLHHLERDEHVEVPCTIGRYAAAALREMEMIPAD